MSKETKPNNQQQVLYYMQLRQQGISGPQAFQMAFPQGLPTNEGPTPEELADEQQKAGLGQIAGLAGGALGTYYLTNALAGGGGGISSLLGGGGGSIAGAGGAIPATPTIVSASAVPSASSAGIAGAAQGGNTIGAVAPIEGASTLGAIAPYAGLAGAGLGAYGLYNAIDQNDTKSGALSGLALGGGLAAAAPLIGLGPVGWGGLALAAALGAGGGAGLTALLGHESTRDVAKKHTKQLRGMGEGNTAWQNYVEGMRAQHNEAAPDPSKPFHGGQYGSWEEYKNAGLDAADLTGVYGNLKTFGPDWANYSFDDRKKVTQGIIDAGLYNSKKGEVEITDMERAKQIRDQLLNNQGGNQVIPGRKVPAPVTQPGRPINLGTGQPMRPVAMTNDIANRVPRPTPGNMPQNAFANPNTQLSPEQIAVLKKAGLGWNGGTTGMNLVNALR